jgi:hypothetical protein
VTDPNDPYAAPREAHPQERPTQPLPYQQPGPPPSGYPSHPQQRWQQPVYAYPQYAVRPPTNGMAIAALVLGILWLYWLGSILALVFGYVALHQIRNAPPQAPQEGRGMALAGVVLGWVGVATLAAMVVGFMGLAATSGL